jgi:cation:H+ antiporter
VLTLSLFVLGRGFGGRPGRISRIDGTLLVLAYVAYSAYLMVEIFGGWG